MKYDVFDHNQKLIGIADFLSDAQVIAQRNADHTGLFANIYEGGPSADLKAAKFFRETVHADKPGCPASSRRHPKGLRDAQKHGAKLETELQAANAETVRMKSERDAQLGAWRRVKELETEVLSLKTSLNRLQSGVDKPVLDQLRAELALQTATADRQAGRILELEKTVEAQQAELESHGTVVHGKVNEISQLRANLKTIQEAMMATVAHKNSVIEGFGTQEERIANLQRVAEEMAGVARRANDHAKRCELQVKEASDRVKAATERLDRIKAYMQKIVRDARDIDAAKSIARHAENL